MAYAESAVEAAYSRFLKDRDDESGIYSTASRDYLWWGRTLETTPTDHNLT